MKAISKVLAVFIVSLPFILATPSMADKAYGKYKCRAGVEGHHGGKHMFSKGWRDTLTDKQKAAIDRLHLGLAREVNTIKAELMLKKAELNGLVTAENPDTGAINKKIKEVVGLKEKIMKAKYSHIVDMRKVLTSVQRASFDLGLLRGGLHGGHHGGGKKTRH
ncbi:MAG: Spy/CpxP family protein refolding chaperone [Thermodesulfobacteriota bacterium]